MWHVRKVENMIFLCVMYTKWVPQQRNVPSWFISQSIWQFFLRVLYVISLAELTDWLIWLVPLDSRKWKLCHYYWKPNKTSLWETHTPVFNGKSISWPHVSGLYHVPHVPGHVPHPMPVTNDQWNVYEHHRELPDWLQMWLCTSRKRCEVLAVRLGVLHDMGGPEP